ncbi:DMT family transporter [Naasia sp. SYSU D00948]|uniref:EamA family transporter n=1 Tax=Naasia sp. SYSU D00948 TaxID=2817379 RepID=UPI001B314E64|nr:EamA family transporter [Naasia sp. SYSU D00948]
MRDETTRGRGGTLAAVGPVVSAVSVQTGAGFGATLLPLLGPVGVVGLRQLFAALVLLPAIVGRRIGLRTMQPALLLGLALLVMNVTIYASIERIGLGLAVTLEFLGPLAVALFTSRRILDVVCGLAAGAGVVLLTGSVVALDPIGVALGLLAGAAWAAYIVLGARTATRLPGVQGTAVASVVASLGTLPFLAVALANLAPQHLPLVLGIGLAVGVLSSALPYSLDLVVLRRIPRSLFSVLQSLHPAAAALAGFVILHQVLSVPELVGLAAISLANAAAVLGSARRDAVARRLAAASPSAP